jgi:hypothetical protein
MELFYKAYFRNLLVLEIHQPHKASRTGRLPHINYLQKKQLVFLFISESAIDLPEQLYNMKLRGIGAVNASMSHSDVY